MKIAIVLYPFIHIMVIGGKVEKAQSTTRFEVKVKTEKINQKVITIQPR